MRISYRTHPALESLEKGTLTNVPIQKDANQDVKALLRRIGSEFVEFCPNFKKEIVSVSQSFLEATGLAQKYLNQLYDGIREEHPEDLTIDGTYIIGGNVFMISTRQEGNHLKLVFFLFDKAGYLRAYFNSTSKEHIKFWLASISPRHGMEDDDIITNLAYSPIVVSLFKKYAEVQVIELPAGQKVKGIDCNYKNDTKSNIIYLDSRWFTTLVKSDAFRVRGHFRLQPKKKYGGWTKEIIWIEEFMKDGYTAEARKLKE